MRTSGLLYLDFQTVTKELLANKRTTEKLA